MLSILSFIFGASIGSFVQVIASRLHVAPIVKGRSKCLSCGEPLRAADLIPIVSYFLLRGKCKYCKTSYGVSAVVVELLFGITFLLLYNIILVNQPTLVMSFAYLAYYTALFIVLGVMALYDRAHSYIPFAFLCSFLVLVFGKYIIQIIDTPDIGTIFAPFFVALPFFAIWCITKGKGLGFGDIILFFGIGAFFGVLQGFAVLIISVWLGALYGLYRKYVVYKNKLKISAIPFVPFIVFGFLIVLFTGYDIFSIALWFA